MAVTAGEPLWRVKCKLRKTRASRAEERTMLNWKVVTQSLAGFAAVSFVLCVGYGLLALAAFHLSWLLEAILPGFKWLQWAGREGARRVTAVRAA